MCSCKGAAGSIPQCAFRATGGLRGLVLRISSRRPGTAFSEPMPKWFSAIDSACKVQTSGGLLGVRPVCSGAVRWHGKSSGRGMGRRTGHRGADRRARAIGGALYKVERMDSRTLILCPSVDSCQRRGNLLSTQGLPPRLLPPRLLLPGSPLTPLPPAPQCNGLAALLRCNGVVAPPPVR